MNAKIAQPSFRPYSLVFVLAWPLPFSDSVPVSPCVRGARKGGGVRYGGFCYTSFWGVCVGRGAVERTPFFGQKSTFRPIR